MGSRNKGKIWIGARRICRCDLGLYHYLKIMKRILYKKNYCTIANLLLIIVWRRIEETWIGIIRTCKGRGSVDRSRREGRREIK